MANGALTARQLAAKTLGYGAWTLTRLSRRLEPRATEVPPSLEGDRDVEWAWSLAHLLERPGRVLDLGAGNGFLSLAAAFRGHDVVAVDLEPASFRFTDERVEYRQGDFNEMSFEPASFDQVLNCSTIEHFGLAGRYGSSEDEDADLVAMARLAELLRPGGTMVLTVPVGRDAVFRPYHRVYGSERLPRLLAPFRIVEQSFRAKRGRVWEEVDHNAALDERGSDRLYALGLFVLTPS